SAARTSCAGLRLLRRAPACASRWWCTLSGRRGRGRSRAHRTTYWPLG
nr:hypothetical protein [Tanacetum cinerariifolium]